MTDNNIKSVIFTPAEAAALAVHYVDERVRNPGIGIPTFIPALDVYMPRCRPGELITVIGRPSNYKSGFMQYVARMNAEKLQEDSSKEIVFYATWEQAVEEMLLMELAGRSGNIATELVEGRVTNKVTLASAARSRAALPLWIIGHSVQRRSKRPRLTMDDVTDAIRFAEDEWGFRPALIMLDYLQRIRPDGNQDTRISNSRNMDKAKDLALEMSCPVFLGCQARREVDDRRYKLPTMRDGAETGNIEHTSDRILSVHYPIKDESLFPGDSLKSIYGADRTVDENVWLLKVVKSKMSKAGDTFVLGIWPGVNEIRQLTR